MRSTHIYNPIMFVLINQLSPGGNNRSLSLPSGLTGPPCPFPQMIGASHRFTQDSHAGVASGWTRADPGYPSALPAATWHVSADTQTSDSYSNPSHTFPKTLKVIQTTMQLGKDSNWPPRGSELETPRCVEHLESWTTNQEINLTPPITSVWGQNWTFYQSHE